MSNSELEHWALAHSIHFGSQKAGRQHVSTGKFAPHVTAGLMRHLGGIKGVTQPLQSQHRDEKASAGGSWSQEETSRSAH